jgi:hypothetical protein
MRDLAAPTAKCAINETVAATMTAGIPVIKKNGMIGINAPIAVESTPETAGKNAAATLAIGEKESQVVTNSKCLPISLYCTRVYYYWRRMTEWRIQQRTRQNS